MNVPGSATKPGHLYHEPAFPAGQPHQRGNGDRWKILQAMEDFAGKTVVDFGCNAGFFTLRAAQAGAKAAHGFDLDADAIRFARQQAIDNGVKNAEFHNRDVGTFYYHEELSPDVVLLFSVIPWIERTEPNPWTILRELFAARTAYVELMYEGDGRAGMVGIRNDVEAALWLRQHYKYAYPVGWTTPSHNGGIRRTIWRCSQEDLTEPKGEPDHVGSQALVYMGERMVLKKGRDKNRYDAKRELRALNRVKERMIAPPPIAHDKDTNYLWTARIRGTMLAEHLKSAGKDRAWLTAEADRICQALTECHVAHNDVRLENLIVGENGRLYLLDFGWATVDGEGTVPDTINPEYKAETDRGSFEKIIDRLC